MDNVTALKALYVAMGGSADTVANMTTNPELIAAIAEQFPSATAAILPAVTADDNGSVLKVVDGAWAVGTDAT